MAKLAEAYPDQDGQGGGDIWDNNKHCEAFVRAIQQDDLDGHDVSKWVHLTGYYAHGLDPNFFGVVEATPLHIAAYCGSSAAARTLLTAGADRNVVAAAGYHMSPEAEVEGNAEQFARGMGHSQLADMIRDWEDPATPARGLKAAFRAFDTDQSGTICESTGLEPTPTPHITLSVLGERSGRRIAWVCSSPLVTASEELKGILMRKGGGQPLSLQEAEALVAEFDANGDHVLQLDEFIAAMTSVGWEASTPICEMMYISSSLTQLQASWDVFASALPGQSLQDTSDREPASGATFTPAIQNNFSVHLLNHVARPSVDARKIQGALQAFAKAVGASADDILAVLAQAGADEGKILAAIVHIYTMQTFFYRELNTALRDDLEDRLQMLTPVIPCLIMSLRVRPYSGTVWRGFPVADVSEAGAYRTGLVFFWPGFSSCSANSMVSKGFASGDMSGHSLLFKITIDANDAGCAADIASASYFKSEAEVLLAPYTCFTVLSTSQHGPRQTLIECTATSTLQNLTGVWSCAEDGGTYYVSQVNRHVVWFGSGPQFGHVFLGKIQGRTLVGTFSDLPTEQWRYDGALALEISDGCSAMRRIPERSGDFAGSIFRRLKGHADTHDAPRLAHKSVRSDGDEGLTGEWVSDQGLVYFVRRLPSKGLLFWFAYSPRTWSAANVFGGTYDPKEGAFVGLYSDVVLSTRFRYSGKIAVTPEGASNLRIRPIEGSYACTSLMRHDAP